VADHPQGRAVGKLFPPLLVFFTRRDGLVEQHPQPAPCDALYSPTVLGALALRSLVAWAYACPRACSRNSAPSVSRAAI